MVFPQVIGPGKKYMEAHSAEAHGLDHKGRLQAVLDAHFEESTQNVNFRQTAQVPRHVQVDPVVPDTLINETRSNQKPAGFSTASLADHESVQPGWNVFR